MIKRMYSLIEGVMIKQRICSLIEGGIGHQKDPARAPSRCHARRSAGALAA